VSRNTLRGFIVECFLPDADEGDLVAIDARAAAVAEQRGEAPELAYRGSILIIDEEVILCLFEGTTVDAVRIAAQQAEIPFERVLAATSCSWPGGKPPSPLDSAGR
jgi:hypothetical protein